MPLEEVLITQETAFNQPRTPRENWVAQLYQQYGLGVNPSLENIEPIATPLLDSIRTALAGAEMVLGRRVDSNPDKEPDVAPVLNTLGLSGADRFGLLLLQYEIEKAQAAQSVE